VQHRCVAGLRISDSGFRIPDPAELAMAMAADLVPFTFSSGQRHKSKKSAHVCPLFPRSPSPPSAPSLFVLFADLSFWQVKGERGRVDC